MQSIALTPIEFEGRIFYDEKELKAIDSIFFKGCSKPRSMIAKKQMREDIDYIGHVSLDPKTKIWKRADSTYKRSKMIVHQDWVVQHVPRPIQPVAPCVHVIESETESNPESETEATTTTPGLNISDDMDVVADADADADASALDPPVLTLEESEKFRDCAGNVVEIEVRGERNAKACWFKAKDVGLAFDRPHLNAMLMNVNRGFIRGIHYDALNLCAINDCADFLIGRKKTIFLTYKGILKVLFSSRGGNAEAFQDWATDKLFTVQMGTQDNRDVLSAALLNTDIHAIKQVFRCTNAKTPCIYLFEIGKVRTLFPDPEEAERVTGNIDASKSDDYSVYKYGRTDDFSRRATEHEVYFKNEFGADIRLVCFALIDPKFVSEAEVGVKHHFRRDHIEYTNRRGVESKEMIVLHKSELKYCKDQFTMIQKSYIGCYEELVRKQTELEQQLASKTAEIELMAQTHAYELLKKDYQILTQEKTIALQEKTVELLEFKLQTLGSTTPTR